MAETYFANHPNPEIHDISSFRGTLLFANDFILDDMTGRYLTLEAGPLS